MLKNFLCSMFGFALISLDLIAESSSQRLNATYDSYFANMSYPNGFNCQDLFYVRKLNEKSGKKEDFIVRDKTEMDISLKNNRCNLVITDLDNCCFKNKMKFHIPNLSDVSSLNSFKIEQRGDVNGEEGTLHIKSQPGIYLESKYESGTFATQGSFKISELLLDIKNNKVLALAIDFAFEDDKANTYDGIIRYNSSVKATLD